MDLDFNMILGLYLAIFLIDLRTIRQRLEQLLFVLYLVVNNFRPVHINFKVMLNFQRVQISHFTRIVIARGHCLCLS